MSTEPMNDRNASGHHTSGSSNGAEDTVSNRRRTSHGDRTGGSRRRGSGILRLEGATLRSVLAVLTGRHDHDNEDSDDSDLPFAGDRRG